MKNKRFIVIVAIIALAMMGCEDVINSDLTPVVTGVTVSPPTAQVAKGGTYTFSATVAGTNNPAQTVSWSIVQTNKHAQTSIGANGVLTVNTAETLGSLTVRATSTVDSTQFGEASVTITGGNVTPTVNSVTVSPPTAQVAKGGTYTFSATVAGTNNPAQTVSWSIVQTNKHSQTSIGANGVLTVNTAETLGSLTVRATSTVNNTKYGEASVTITGGNVTPTVNSVTVSPPTAQVAKGTTYNFTATVTGANNPAQTVSWSIVQTNKHSQTSISANGVLTVNAAETLGSLTVRATSTVDNTKYGEATVTITGGNVTPTVNSVTVSPPTVQVAKGGTYTFSATVTGTNNPAQTVSWSIVQSNKHAQTSIGANGVLTVNAAETLGSLTVRATSTVDSTKYGEATVTITGGSTPAPVPNQLTGNMGNYDFGYLHDGITRNYQNGGWVFSGENVSALLAAEKIEIVLNARPTVEVQFVWMDTNTWSWNSTDIVSNTGVVQNGAEWNAVTKTLTINFATAIANRSNFLAQTGEIHIIIVSSHSNINDLGMVSADLISGSGGFEPGCPECGAVQSGGIWHTAQNATCITEGTREFRCAGCQTVLETGIISALGHNFQNYTTEVSPASCTAAQVMQAVCERGGCNATDTRTGTPALGHDSGTWFITENATCTEAGTKRLYCNRCQEVRNTNTIPALGHEFLYYTTEVSPASCTAAQVMQAVCERDGCNATDARDGTPALGHDSGTWFITENATCTEAGTKRLYCNRCHEVRNTNTIPALGHEFQNYAQVSPVSCTAAQVMQAVCERDGCNTTDARDGTPALGHEFQNYTQVSPVSCTAAEVMQAVCERGGCNATDTRNGTPALGHNFQNYTTEVSPASCTAAQVMQAVCERDGCNATDTRAGAPALGHDDGIWHIAQNISCTTAEIRELRCTRCQAVMDTSTIPALGHNWHWELTTSPTATTTGLRTEKCLRCNAINGTEVIPIIQSGIQITIGTGGQMTSPNASIIGGVLTLKRNATATLALENSSQYTNIRWRVQNTAITGSGASFTLNGSNTAFVIGRDYFVTVEALRNGAPYNVTITFKVEE